MADLIHLFFVEKRFDKQKNKLLDLECTPGSIVKTKEDKAQMTIKEVSEKYGISQDTLRYYERVKMIPRVTRTKSNIRDYQEKDLKWVELVLCMRSAGLPIEESIEYLKLFQKGDETIPARLDLLRSQMDSLKEQKEQIEKTMERLSYKIKHYEEALKTGKLAWD